MVVVESSMAGGRKEVALAATALLAAVLQVRGAGGRRGEKAEGGMRLISSG